MYWWKAVTCHMVWFNWWNLENEFNLEEITKTSPKYGCRLTCTELFGGHNFNFKLKYFSVGVLINSIFFSI